MEALKNKFSTLEVQKPSPKDAAGVQKFKLGDWTLQSGQSIPNAEIAYKTFGDPSLPAIIYPSWYSGR
jgi:homoserine acetyltransferase